MDGTYALDRWHLLGKPFLHALQESLPRWVVVSGLTFGLLTGTRSARAQDRWVLERSWGSFGTGPGQFRETVDVKVGDGIVYVSDVGNDRVQAFSTEGVYLFEWGSTGSGDGEFMGPEGLAIDEHGVLYVADDGNCRVQRFSLDGQFLSAWPRRCGNGPGQLGDPRLLAAAGGNVYVVAHFYNSIERFTDGGEFILEIVGYGDSGYYGIALGPDGTLWTTVPEPGIVRHLGPEGDLLQQWSAVPPGSPYAGPSALDLNTGGNLFIANGIAGTVEEFASDGTHLETIPVDTLLPRGLDLVNDRELYVVGATSRVLKYVRQPVPVEPATWGGIKRSFR